MTDVVKIIGREEHARGLAEGREAGREEGRQEGREEGLLEMAGKLLASGMDIEQVAKFTGLDHMLLERLKAEK